MIKLNLNFESSFKSAYFNFCYSTFISDRLIQVRSLLPNDNYVRDNFDILFNQDSIREIIECPANELENIIKTIFDLFPIIAERYHYSYLLEQVTIKQGCINLTLQNEAQRDYFDSIVSDTIIELEKLTHTNNLVVTNYYLNDLRDPTLSRTHKRKVLCRLENSARGNSVLTKKYVGMFPTWVNELKNVFDYNLMVSEYGYSLTTNADVTICVYCGLEKIQTYNTDDIRVRPDLDHFYPKSRFPFLALSLFNLIPAGGVCNQKHKRNTSMLGYMHPCLDSIQDDTFFHFSFIDSTRVKDTLRVGVLPQHNFKDANISIFKIQPLYEGDEELRDWYSKLYGLYEFYKANGADLASMDFTSVHWKHTITLDAPSTKVSAQKFKVDAINDLFGSELRVIEQ
ncbi:TPA: hypothetical protein ACX6S7_000676 [Photobacterium damselae]